MNNENDEIIDIEKLPDYLESKKNNKVIVGMGRIIVPNPYVVWLNRLSAVAALFAFLLVGTVFFNEYRSQDITLVVDVYDLDENSFKKFISDSGAKIVSLEQKENYTYEVKINTKKDKKNIIEILSKNKFIKIIE
jgi:hypothetical protein